MFGIYDIFITKIDAYNNVKCSVGQILISFHINPAYFETYTT